jgi:hypothetical protein
MQLKEEDNNGVPSILQEEDPFNKYFEEPEYDWLKEGDRLHSLNILQLSEFHIRQRKLVSYLENALNILPGFKVIVDRSRTWCKVLVYRIGDPYYMWIAEEENMPAEKIRLVHCSIPGQCGVDEFEIGLKDMHSLNVDISHISDYNGRDLFEECLDDYPTVTLSSPMNIVSLLLEFQKNGNL